MLPAQLRHLYDGDLWFGGETAGRPYTIGNFVSTLDGIVSFAIPGKAGGGEISGSDEADRFVMGLLRASADAVMVGGATLHATARRHVWVAGSVYAKAEELYTSYRKEVLGKTQPPFNVIVSGSGLVDLRAHQGQPLERRRGCAQDVAKPGGRADHGQPGRTAGWSGGCGLV